MVFKLEPTDYEHDIFISYKREAFWTPWVRDLFCMHLRAYLSADLGRTPSIFIDEKIQAGRDLPSDLGRNLALSKVFIPIFSRDYFSSEWCIHELDLILERNAHFREVSGGSQHLIIPIVVHDGDLIPHVVQPIMRREFSKFWVTTMAPRSQLAEDFSVALKEFSPAVQSAIEAAPAFDFKWVDHHKVRFTELQARGADAVVTKNFTISQQAPSRAPRPLMG